MSDNKDLDGIYVYRMDEDRTIGFMPSQVEPITNNDGDTIEYKCVLGELEMNIKKDELVFVSFD